MVVYDVEVAVDEVEFGEIGDVIDVLVDDLVNGDSVDVADVVMVVGDVFIVVVV